MPSMIHQPPGRPPIALAPALRAMLPGSVGRVAVTLGDVPVLRVLQRRRLADALLEDAARSGGGSLYRTSSGKSLLFASAPGPAKRAATALAQLLDDSTATTTWRIPEQGSGLLRWAADETLATTARAAPHIDSVAGLGARLEQLGTEHILRAEALAGADGTLRGHRFRLIRHAIAAGLGSLDDDPDILADAEQRLAAKLLPGLGAWAAAGPGLRLVPIALRQLPTVAPQGGAVGVLTLRFAAGGLPPALRWQLAERGWRVAIDDLCALTVPRLRLAALPADFLLIRWAPALAERGPTSALRDVSPDRIILTDADAEGRAWAESQAIRCFSVPKS